MGENVQVFVAQVHMYTLLTVISLKTAPNLIVQNV